ncbi:hypothetical protein GFC01_14175 [Desulfofundulus thermobenzoicus]|uniref:Uncharacterized protein n=1 Tax=Desulfofundulus thermobenzoicus TaxID=29376 RepID=A0A6N7ITH9_9FIRM|nr:hypothetical protein [Desulfofundulus thermobenzoicus]MQL53384.1 hypothetical protein [Desulfofundulus thermobenzoicus]
MPSLADWAKSQGYKVTKQGSYYTITNPVTGKSTRAWEGVQYTGGNQLAGLGSLSPTGGSSGSSGADYQSILQNYFGGDYGAYAAEIKRKQQAGIPFTDPAAAQAFMQAYPHYFTTNQPTYSETPNVPRSSPLIGGSVSQYSFPYEQLLRDLLSQAQTSYTAPTESELQQQAHQYAILQTDPVLSAIKSRLEQAQKDYESQKAAIEAAYSTVPQTTQRLLEEARQSALEQAIARGMGRSGAVEWLTTKLSAPIMEQATQSEQEKAAKLAAAANTLAQIQQEAERQQQETMQRQGELESYMLQQLRDQIAQRMVQQQGDIWSRAAGLASMAQAANLSQQQYLLNLLQQLLYG